MLIYIPHQLDKNFSVRVIVCIIIIPIYIPHQLDKNENGYETHSQWGLIYIPHQLDKNTQRHENTGHNRIIYIPHQLDKNIVLDVESSDLLKFTFLIS